MDYIIEKALELMQRQPELSFEEAKDIIADRQMEMEWEDCDE